MYLNRWQLHSYSSLHFAELSIFCQNHDFAYFHPQKNVKVHKHQKSEQTDILAVTELQNKCCELMTSINSTSFKAHN